MKRRLLEAKADLECGLAKALSLAALNSTELNEIEKLTVVELITDHGLDPVMAEKVLVHAQTERYRMKYQKQQTPDAPHLQDFEPTAGSFSRTHPLTEARLYKIVKEVHKRRTQRVNSIRSLKKRLRELK